MPAEAMKIQRWDEDTDLGFLGHKTSQSGDQPEQHPDDRERRETGPEGSPNQPSGPEERRGKQSNQGNRK